MHRRATISLLLGLAGALIVIGCSSSDDGDGSGGSGGSGGSASTSNGGGGSGASGASGSGGSGGTTSTGDGGSCSGYNGTTECLEYTGADWDQTTAGIHCQGMQGTYSSGACDPTGAVGRCTISAGDPLEYYHYYYERVDEAEVACGLNDGVWELL